MRYKSGIRYVNILIPNGNPKPGRARPARSDDLSPSGWKEQEVQTHDDACRSMLRNPSPFLRTAL